MNHIDREMAMQKGEEEDDDCAWYWCILPPILIGAAFYLVAFLLFLLSKHVHLANDYNNYRGRYALKPGEVRVTHRSSREILGPLFCFFHYDEPECVEEYQDATEGEL